MERAARLIKKKIADKILSDEDVACAVWPAAVGSAIALHTGRVSLVRSTLVVQVEDAIWQRQLNALSFQILERIRKLTGSDQIKDIEFRIGIPRREPQRAQSRSGDLQGMKTCEDEAERIGDPVLKKLYRLSRRKAIG